MIQHKMDQAVKMTDDREGKYLTFTREGVRVYLSIDEGPRWLLGVKVTGPDDVAAVAEALEEESPLRLVLWCTCCLPAEFG